MTDLHSHIARREDILARLRRVIVEDLHVDREPRDIDPDTPIFGTGLGLDSVDAVEIMVSLEDAFDISVPDDPRVRSAMRTLNTLIDFILVNGRAAAERDADADAGPRSEGAS